MAEMSELKAYTFSAMERVGLADYYLKSEADKVIAHHKYKRCLLRSVIAEMNAIHFKDLFYGEGSDALADEYNKQITIHYKWQKRWLALAEKFKGAK